SIVPSFVCALCVPIIIRWSLGLATDTSSLKHTRGYDSVIEHAQTELNKMGSMSMKEWQLCCVLLGCLGMWVTSSITHLDSALIALLGIVALLHMGTMSWKDVSSNTNAWDTLFWLGGFVTIAQQFSDAGASTFLGHKISFAIQRFHLSPTPSLAIAYFLTTFLFSSLSAHTVAFVSTFLDAGHALGAHPMVLTALLSYFSTLGGCMTNFSTGMSAMYYAPGYVPRIKCWWSFLGWLK
ncbi:hypothetical protein CU098_012142, partial [Rhizopus stolonifer]